MTKEERLALVQHFAGHALTGLLANPNHTIHLDADIKRFGNLAWAYAIVMVERYENAGG